MLHFSRSSNASGFAGAVAITAAVAVLSSAGAQEAPGDGLEPAWVAHESIERDGISIDFRAAPARPEITGGQIMEAGMARLEFRITSAEDGEPLRGTYPGVWIDLVQTAEGQARGVALECRNRVSTYLQGAVGMRPLIDLNSYFVLVLNQDASISVIDPVVGITGVTSLYTSIPLERPGADWTKTQDETTMFVSMPRAEKVAVIDLDTFKVVKNIDAGESPMRTRLQPDQRYLWIGNDTADGGVTVVDTTTREVVATIPTGAGHHEIEFALAASRAYVTNRDAGTVSIIDTESLTKIADLGIGRVPISVAHSHLSGAAYVGEGESGTMTVLDEASAEVVTHIELEPGIGPMRFSYDGRWGFIVNPQTNEVYVIDASTNELTHTIPVTGRPYQITLTETFAYVRSLDSERISMINLQELNRGSSVVVNNFAAGTLPPSDVSDLRLTDGMAPAAQEAAVLVTSPADATVYYYMEGMNAPMGAFRNYGHRPLAVQIANRALKETAPGVYSGTIKVPLAGKFEIAFLNETPQILHCFTMDAAINPNIERAHEPVAVEFLSDRTSLPQGEAMHLRFRLVEPGSGRVIEDPGRIAIKYFRVPRYNLTELEATAVGDGLYEAELRLPAAGSYYIYVAAPSLGVGYQDLNYQTVIVSRSAVSQATGG